MEQKAREEARREVENAEKRQDMERARLDEVRKKEEEFEAALRHRAESGK